MNAELEKWIENSSSAASTFDPDVRCVSVAALNCFLSGKVLVPVEVLQWYEAFSEYVRLSDAYNAHLKYVKENCPFGTSVNEQWQAMDSAQRKASSLVYPMYKSMLAASQELNNERD
jgi:hypothetical protein